MNDNIIFRLDELFAVLIYCSDQQQVGRPASFTELERICINQERGSILSQLNQETPPHEVRRYTCPAKLESKIQFALKKLNQ